MLITYLLDPTANNYYVPADGLEPPNPKEGIYSPPQLPLCDTGAFISNISMNYNKVRYPAFFTSFMGSCHAIGFISCWLQPYLFLL